MGACCSCHVSFAGKVYDVESESEPGTECACAVRECGARVRLSGSSKCVSMYCQKGRKGDNQDAMTVWEEFTGNKDMIFCGVFDGHGPQGDKFSQCVRDELPAKLSEAIKMSQLKGKHHDAKSAHSGSTSSKHTGSSSANGGGHRNQNMSFASWEGIFLKSFIEMDEDLAKNIDTDGFCGGSTAVTLVKQGDQLIIGNLGDSRAVLCTRTDDNYQIAIQLTCDLKPEIPSEASRIIDCGGRVFAAKEDPGVGRIWMPEEDCPGLAMSRAFGDFCLKDHGLTSVPDVIYRRINNQDEFVVLASDGVWDVLTNTEVVNIVASAPRKSEAAKLLVKCAVRAWGYKYPRSAIDDCTVICLFLKD